MTCRTVVWILLTLQPGLLLAQATTVTCSSKEGERQNCPADTSAGVALQRSLGPAECLLGKTWGYSGDLIWISDGCSGEFLLGQLATSPRTPPASQAEQPIETWRAVEAGKGFLVGRTEVGELNIFSRRIMIFFKGWTGITRLLYQIIVWTVNTTDQKNIFAVPDRTFLWPTRPITGSTQP